MTGTQTIRPQQFAVIGVERLWQHRTHDAAAVGATLGSCSGSGSRPAKATKPTGQANVPRAMTGSPIA